MCQRLSWIKQSANKLRVKDPFQRSLCILLARFYARAKQAVTLCFTRRKPKKTNVELGTDSQRSFLGFTGETEQREAEVQISKFTKICIKVTKASPQKMLNTENNF